MIRTVNRNTGRSGKLTRTSRIYQGVSDILVGSVPWIPSHDKYNITISHEKKFIWFRVAKVGTRTIFDMFDQAKVNLDADQAMFCRYPVGFYEDYFMFGFVRNPWDRVVSCWIDKIVNTNYYKFSNEQLERMQAFDAFVDFVEGLDISACDQHLRLQSKLIDLNSVNFVGRFERFEESLSEVSDIIGLGNIAIQKINASKRDPDYRAYYSSKLRDRVASVYARDISIFGYGF